MQPAPILIDAYTRSPLPGHVEHIAFEDKTVNNVTIYEVDVRPDEVPPCMRSGMTANLTFHVETKKNVLTLPGSAVRGQGESATVKLPGPKGKPVDRSIRTGLSNGKTVEIIEGLAEGDRVVVTNGMPAVSSAAKTNPLSPMPRRPGRQR